MWRKQVGQGFSGPVVAQGRVILFHRVGQRGSRGIAGCAHRRAPMALRIPDDIPRRFRIRRRSASGARGCERRGVHVRCQGQLHAIDLATGTRIWRTTRCGVSASPKGFRRRRIAARRRRPGARQRRRQNAGIVAFDAKTGKVLWTATNDEASYSSAVGATVSGRRYAIFLHARRTGGSRSGKRQGAVSARMAGAAGGIGERRDVRSSSAICIFVSAEYGPGAGVLPFDGATLIRLWRRRGAVEPLRDERPPDGVSVRLPWAPGVRPEFRAVGSADRESRGGPGRSAPER